MSDTEIRIPVRDEIAQQLKCALFEYQDRCKVFRESLDAPYGDETNASRVELEVQKSLAGNHAREVFELVLASIGARS